MVSKKILITISDTPLGQVPIYENLRTALGVTAGYKEHKINVVFTGDSVFLALMPRDHELLRKFITSFKLIDSTLYFDEKSLEDRNINKGLVKEPFGLINRDGIFELLKNTDLNFSF